MKEIIEERNERKREEDEIKIEPKGGDE